MTVGDRPRAGLHPGELDAQRRYDDPDMTTRVMAMVRDTLSPTITEFLAGLRLLFLCAPDDDGLLWVSPRSGEPGFVTVADDRTVVVGSSFAGDPLARAFAAPRPVGAIALDPSRARRARVNGTAVTTADGTTLRVSEAFANCKRFIRRREPTGDASPPAGDDVAVEARTALSDAQRRAVATTDTAIVGTVSSHGADCSHRGGDPGFVEVLDDTHVRWRERDGNAMLASVGNLLLDPRCALTIPDLASGTATLLSGVAQLAWPDTGRPDLADGRSPEVTMTIRRCVTVPGATAPWLDAD